MEKENAMQFVMKIVQWINDNKTASKEEFDENMNKVSDMLGKLFGPNL